MVIKIINSIAFNRRCCVVRNLSKPPPPSVTCPASRVANNLDACYSLLPLHSRSVWRGEHTLSLLRARAWPLVLRHEQRMSTSARPRTDQGYQVCVPVRTRRARLRACPSAPETKPLCAAHARADTDPVAACADGRARARRTVVGQGASRSRLFHRAAGFFVHATRPPRCCFRSASVARTDAIISLQLLGILALVQ